MTGVQTCALRSPLYVRLPYSLFKEFKLLGYSDNERAKDMELWMIERTLLGLSSFLFYFYKIKILL